MAKVIARAYISITNVNDGEKGDTGDTALTLIVTPNTFTFQTNDEGDIENLAQNKGKIRMFLGQTEVVPSSISITPTNCYARIAGDNTLYIDGVSPNQWSGNVKITAKYKGQTRTATAEFMVSAQKWNEAKFLANDTQFKSIIAQNEADKQGLESRMTTIEQDAGKIRLEVKKQTFGGVNLLKGASLRSDEVSLIKGKSHKICIHETINIRRDNQGHNMHPYLEINVSGRTQDLYSSGRFWTWLEAGKTYVFSMYYKVFGYATSTLSIAVARSNEYTGDAANWLNGEGEDTIIKDYNWHRYTRRYAINTTGYYFFAPALQRNGRVFISEVQLEEGTKPTGWHDPDVVESMEAAGIYLNGNDMSINARSKHFRFIDQQGNTVASVDDTGAIDGLKFRTRNLGAGYIDLTGSLMSVYGTVAKNIEFGIDDKGRAILKFYDNAGNNTLNLSPDGLKAESISVASFTALGVCYIGGFQVIDYPAEHSIFNPYFVNTTPSGTSVYLYTGATIQGKFIADGGWSQSQVEANNGKYFQSNNTELSNFAVNGVYAACLPQVILQEPGNTSPVGGTTSLPKMWQIITIYVFRRGKISSFQLRRETTL